MAEAKVKITAEDKASKTIDHVTKRLGIFNKEGLSMGITFAVVTKAIQYAEQGLKLLTDSFINGIRSSMDYQYNVVQLTNVLNDMNMSVGQLRQELLDLSGTYGVNINVLAAQMRMFARLGYSSSQSLKMLNETERFAKANAEDLESTIAALNTTMEVFDLNADDSTYILSKLNELFDTTSLSMQNIDNIFSRAAPNIRESGYSLNDIVNILYTLSREGSSPRTILSEINKILEDIGDKKIDVLPESEVKGIDEKFKNIDDTSKSFWEKQAQNWDNFWFRVGQGIEIAGDWLSQKYVFKNGVQIPVEEPSNIKDLFSNVTPPLEDWGEAQERLTNEIKDSTAAISTLEPLVEKYLNDLDRSQAAYQYAQDMHAATLEVRRQEDAIERLRRVANKYSLEQQINQLAIMRIQYGAMGTRRGLTRGQQRQIDIIERENMGLRIAEMEQQIEIGNIQMNGLQTAQDRLDALKRAHDEVIYAEELETLSAHIDEVYKLWSEMYQKLAREKQALLSSTQAQINLNAAPSGRIGLSTPATRNAPAVNVNVAATVNTPLDADKLGQLMGNGLAKKLFDNLGLPLARVR